MKRLALVAYDIADNKRRRRAFRRISPHRCDGQLSVHECWLTPVHARALLEDLSLLLDLEQDRLIFTWVEPAQIAGTAPATTNSPLLLT